MQRIGIMGGTFNPIHTGHLIMAETAMENLRLDRVIFIPTNKPAYKSELAEAGHRLNMTNIACEYNPFFSVSDIDIKRGGSTYSVDTLKELKEMYPNAKLYFIIGGDSVLTLHKWKNAPKLFKMCSFAALGRQGLNTKAIEKEIKKLGEEYKGEIIFTEAPAIDISSTKIREKIEAGKAFKYMIPQKVEEYIKEKELYGFKCESCFEVKEFKKRLEIELKPKRYIHTLGVAEEAQRLAKRYGESAFKAYIAGLLHDCAKNFSQEKTFELCKKYNVELDDMLMAQPALIHPFLGAKVAYYEYGIRDKDILNAIKYHTTARGEGMTPLEEIVYLADMIEPNRTYYDGLDKIRKLAYYDLNGAMREALLRTITFNREKGGTVYPLSQKAFDYFDGKLKKPLLKH